MPRNGSGGYTPPTNSWNPATVGNSATPVDFAALLADISTAISQSMSADGQTPVTANIPMSNKKFTGLAEGTGVGDSVRWQQLFDQGTETDVASATTCDIGAVNSNFLRITGTSTITSFGTNYRGPRFVRFADSLTLTHNASTLILPGGVNITTSAGDCALIRPVGSPSAGWAVVAYQTGSDYGAGMVWLGPTLNYVAGTVGAHINADAVFVTDFMTDAQYADWVAKAGAVNMYSAFVAAHNAALASKRSVFAPAGQYRLESKLSWSPQVSLRGDAKSWWANSSGYPYISGTWFYKAHNDYCIEVVGASANTHGSDMAYFTIRSDWATYPSGGGIWVDKVAEQRLSHINVIYVSGDSFHIGDTAGDVTTHCYLTDCYSNNSAARSFYIRAKWTRGYHCRSDGGTWGLHLQDSPQSVFQDSHFEGFTTGALYATGSNHCALKGKSYIGNSSVAPKGVELVSNSDYFTIDKTHLVGSGSTGNAVSINTCTGVSVLDCVIGAWGKGVLDGGTDSTIRDCAFDACGLPIEITGNRSNYHDNRMTSTSGSYSILMNAAGTVSGSWTGNDVDKPMYSAATSTTTDFGGIRVVGNPGHKTESAGITGSIASGATVAHGLAGTPQGIAIALTTSGATNMAWSADATNITFTWTGGNQQISWNAWNKCAKQ